jgi:hypothetical protein
MTEPLDEPMYVRRTLASRRRDIIKILTEHPEYSDRRITTIAVVSRELVTRIRRNLIRLARIDSRHARQRIGADGKIYKRLPQPREVRS